MSYTYVILRFKHFIRYNKILILALVLLIIIIFTTGIYLLNKDLLLFIKFIKSQKSIFSISDPYYLTLIFSCRRYLYIFQNSNKNYFSRDNYFMPKQLRVFDDLRWFKFNETRYKDYLHFYLLIKNKKFFKFYYKGHFIIYLLK